MVSYSDRPWTALYDEGIPSDPDLPFPTALAMFDATLARSPEAPLLHYIDSTLTVEDVARLSDALAVALSRRFGVGKGDRVMAQLQNMPAFVIALLASWRLGAILVPINPMYLSLLHI